MSPTSGLPSSSLVKTVGEAPHALGLVNERRDLMPEYFFGVNTDELIVFGTRTIYKMFLSMFFLENTLE